MNRSKLFSRVLVTTLVFSFGHYSVQAMDIDDMAADRFFDHSLSLEDGEAYANQAIVAGKLHLTQAQEVAKETLTDVAAAAKDAWDNVRLTHEQKQAKAAEIVAQSNVAAQKPAPVTEQVAQVNAEPAVPAAAPAPVEAQASQPDVAAQVPAPVTEQATPVNAEPAVPAAAPAPVEAQASQPDVAAQAPAPVTEQVAPVNVEPTVPAAVPAPVEAQASQPDVAAPTPAPVTEQAAPAAVSAGNTVKASEELKKEVEKYVEEKGLLQQIREWRFVNIGVTFVQDGTEGALQALLDVTPGSTLAKKFGVATLVVVAGTVGIYAVRNTRGGTIIINALSKLKPLVSTWKGRAATTLGVLTAGYMYKNGVANGEWKLPAVAVAGALTIYAAAKVGTLGAKIAYNAVSSWFKKPAKK